MGEEIIVLSNKQQAREKINVWHGSSSNWINMVKELSGNSLDIFDNNKLNHIKIIIHNKNKIEYIDDATGIPIEGTASNGQPNYEAIFEVPFAGSKYSNSATVGCNGIFLFTLSATCEDIEYFIARPNGNIYNIAYHKGDRVKELNIVGKSKETYSRIVFLLDTDVWDKPNFTFNEICNIVQGQSSLCNVVITVEDKENDLHKEFYYENGIVDYFEELTSNKTMITDNIRITKEVKSKVEKNNEIDNINVDLLFNYSNDSEDDIQKDFLNTADLIQHGTIQDGIILGFKNAIHKWLKDNGKYNKGEKNITLDDVSNGLNYICNVKSYNAEYVSQVKQQSLTPHYKPTLQHIIEDFLQVFFIENKIVTELICNQVLLNSRVRVKSDITRQNIKKKLSESNDTFGNKVAKLTDSKIHGEEAELFIAEGLSAKTSLVDARNPKIQGVYALRGKVLNCLKASYDEIFKNDVILDLIRALGCGVKVNHKKYKEFNSFDITKLKYGKIIIGVDADPDGIGSICPLILTMIYRLMPELLYQGKVYMALTPLFNVKDSNDKIHYCYTEEEKENLIKNLKGKYTVKRVKGLGEQNADDMYITAMNPETRRMIKIEVDDAKKMIDMFELWMGTEVEPRKEYIIEHLHEYFNYED